MGGELLLLVGRIDGKLDAAIARYGELDDRLKSQGERIAHLETTTRRWAAYAAVLAFLASLVAPLAAKLLPFIKG